MRALRQLKSPRHRRMAAMKVIDRLVPVRSGRVTLVAKKTFGVSGNIRVLTDAFADRGDKEVFLFFEGELPPLTRRCLEAKGICILSEFSAGAARVIASSELIVVDHSILDCYVSIRKRGRTIANVWHGVPIKCIELLMPGIDDERRRIAEHNATLYDRMIASSPVDRAVMSAAFGVPIHRIAVTGLPRYDLLDDAYPLPEDLREIEQEIIRKKAGRKLVLYAPTFREQGPSPVPHVCEKLNEINSVLVKRGMVFGLRPHPYDQAAKNLVETDGCLVFDNKVFPETNLLLKHTDFLVSDFSSIWVDYLLMNRPILGFAPDLEHYRSSERGFLYPFEELFPGVFAQTIEGVLGNTAAASSGMKHLQLPRAMLLDHPVGQVRHRTIDWFSDARRAKSFPCAPKDGSSNDSSQQL